MSGPVEVPDKPTLPMVEPQSATISLKTRMAERKPNPEPEPKQEPVVRSRSALHSGVPVLLPPNPMNATLPEPFSFENRYEVMFEKKEDKRNSSSSGYKSSDFDELDTFIEIVPVPSTQSQRTSSSS